MLVKVNTDYLDCFHNEDIVCPFCKGEQSNSWEYDEREESVATCEWCDREFNIFPVVKFTSAPNDATAHWNVGDIFEDGITDPEAEQHANNAGNLPCEVVE